MERRFIHRLGFLKNSFMIRDKLLKIAERNGYKVVVPYMDKPWCIHDDGFLNLSRYDEFRDIFLKEYK